MSFKLADRVKEFSGTVGTGDIALSGAMTGYRSFADIGNGVTTEYMIMAVDGSGNPTGNWEIGIGVYTASGTTLSRAVVLSNSAGTGLLQNGAGTKISFAAGLQHVHCGVGRATLLPQNNIFNARLTSKTGVPVSLSDWSGVNIIYLTPYQGNKITLNTNGHPVIYQLASDILLNITGSTGQVKDVFLYSNAGVLTLELSAAWASTTTRTDAVVLVDGIEYKSDSALNKLLVGTIYFSGTNTIEDRYGGGSSQVGGSRFLWNRFNRVLRPMRVIDTTNSWTQAAPGTLRQANGASGNKVDYVCGLALDSVSVLCNASGQSDSVTALNMACAIGIDSVTARSGYPGFGVGSASNIPAMTAFFIGQPGIGYHYLAWLEAGGSTGVTTWYGDAGETVRMQSGLTASVWC